MSRQLYFEVYASQSHPRVLGRAKLLSWSREGNGAKAILEYDYNFENVVQSLRGSTKSGFVRKICLCTTEKKSGGGSRLWLPQSSIWAFIRAVARKRATLEVDLEILREDQTKSEEMRE